LNWGFWQQYQADFNDDKYDQSKSSLDAIYYGIDNVYVTMNMANIRAKDDKDFV